MIKIIQIIVLQHSLDQKVDFSSRLLFVNEREVFKICYKILTVLLFCLHAYLSVY